MHGAIWHRWPRHEATLKKSRLLGWDRERNYEGGEVSLRKREREEKGARFAPFREEDCFDVAERPVWHKAGAYRLGNTASGGMFFLPVSLHNVYGVRFCEFIVKGVCRQRVGSFCVSFRYFMYNFLLKNNT